MLIYSHQKMISNISKQHIKEDDKSLFNRVFSDNEYHEIIKWTQKNLLP